MLNLVPFNAAWIAHDKIDIHAIYRRPRFKEDAYGELERELSLEGLPTWDIVGPLPIKQHTKWTQKGFEYITLANRPSLLTAGRYGTVLLPEGGSDPHWQRYDQHQTGGPWNYKRYAEGQKDTITRESAQLKADVDAYGWKAVEAIRRQTDPTFTLPDHMKQPPKEAAPIEPLTAEQKNGKPQTKKETTAA